MPKMPFTIRRINESPKANRKKGTKSIQSLRKKGVSDMILTIEEYPEVTTRKSRRVAWRLNRYVKRSKRRQQRGINHRKRNVR